MQFGSGMCGHRLRGTRALRVRSLDMEPAYSLTLGVIAVRTSIDSPWQSHEWQPTAVILGGSQLSPGSLMRRESGADVYFAGSSTLHLHKTEAASYRTNIEQDAPRLYVVLEPKSGAGGALMPRVHLITAAPDEAEAYLEGDEWLIGSVPMPMSLRDTVAAFVDEYYVPPQPRKGARKPNRSSAIGPKPGATS